MIAVCGSTFFGPVTWLTNFLSPYCSTTFLACIATTLIHEDDVSRVDELVSGRSSCCIFLVCLNLLAINPYVFV
jgi:hypothetical protein